MKTKLPERWLEYAAVGNRVPGTRFIAFKVPLKKLFDTQLAPWQRFSTSDLLSEIEKRSEELGLIVDLTCTNRYYDPQELPATVKYAKIYTSGQQLPSDEVIADFKRVVKQFLNENYNNEKLVGVHCTHGLNRTGYMVCRFMIDVLGMVPLEAIEKFNQSRGHHIERQNYLDDLLLGIPRNHQCANVNLGPQMSTPQFPQLAGRHIPGPQHRFQQMEGPMPGFACVGAASGIIGVPVPYMLTPTFWPPQAADPRQQLIRGGPQNHPHPAGLFARHQHFGPANGPYGRWPIQDRRGVPRQQWQ